MSNPILNIAEQAARHAAKHLHRQIDMLSDCNLIPSKRAHILEKVTIQAFNEMQQLVQASHPEHLCCMPHTLPAVTDKTCWIINPLEGLAYYSRGSSHYVISIAIMNKGQCDAALLYHPLSEEIYVATRNHGTQLNQRRIRQGKKNMLKADFFVCGAGNEAIVKYMKTSSKQAINIDMTHLPSLAIAHTAASRYDGFWDKLPCTTHALHAATLIAQEAGCEFTETTAQNDDTRRFIIIGNRRAHPQILDSVAQFSD